jgi:hypothetical protein
MTGNPSGTLFRERVADHPAFWIMERKEKSRGLLLIIVLHLEVRIVSMASA